jgi:hypothetical protein
VDSQCVCEGGCFVSGEEGHCQGEGCCSHVSCGCLFLLLSFNRWAHSGGGLCVLCVERAPGSCALFYFMALSAEGIRRHVASVRDHVSRGSEQGVYMRS